MLKSMLRMYFISTKTRKQNMDIYPEYLNDIMSDLERRQENSNVLQDDGSVSELDTDLPWEIALAEEFQE